MRRTGCFLLTMMMTATVQATCTRSINVPLAPVGRSVAFEQGTAQGVYPALLREVAQASQCRMDMHKVPRARLQTLFDVGQADLLVLATATPARDAMAEFVPLVEARTSLLTLDAEPTLPRSLAELLALPDYKLVVVRGFSFGPAYDNAVATLRKRQRLLEEADVVGVARALRLGLGHATIMAASTLVGTLVSEPELSPLLKQLRVEPLEELGWSTSGLYLSRRSLREADRRLLRQALGQAARGGRVWQLFNEHHPPGSLSGSIRPLPDAP